MLEIRNDGDSTTIKASGKHMDLLKEAIQIDLHIHKFVCNSLGEKEYLLFLLELQNVTSEEAFFDFLHSDPDKLTHIEIPIPPKEEDK